MLRFSTVVSSVGITSESIFEPVREQACNALRMSERTKYRDGVSLIHIADAHCLRIARDNRQLHLFRRNQSRRQMALRSGKVFRVGRVCCDRLSHRSTKERHPAMAQQIKVWFDAEADFLEVQFTEKAGFMRETNNDAVMERVDEQGNVLGFSIMQVSQLAKGKPLVAELV
jgi:uncharacterized protein YuzE